MNNNYLSLIKIIEFLFYGLIIGTICYFFELWQYQFYRSSLNSSESITFIPYPFTLTYWNFALPIAFIAILVRLVFTKLFIKLEKAHTFFLEGVLIGLGCILFGIGVFYLNHYINYLYLGDFESGYFYSLPLYGFPLDIIFVIPLANMFYRLLARKVLNESLK